jgi:hypothetical protein
MVPPPPPNKGPWSIVFGILSLVLLLAGGGVGALYYNERTKVTDHRTQIADLQRQVEDAQEDLTETERDLQRAEDDLADLEQCPAAVQALLEAVAEAGGEISDADAGALGLELISACGVAV